MHGAPTKTADLTRATETFQLRQITQLNTVLTEHCEELEVNLAAAYDREIKLADDLREARHQCATLQHTMDHSISEHLSQRARTDAAYERQSSELAKHSQENALARETATTLKETAEAFREREDALLKELDCRRDDIQRLRASQREQLAQLEVRLRSEMEEAKEHGFAAMQCVKTHAGEEVKGAIAEMAGLRARALKTETEACEERKVAAAYEAKALSADQLAKNAHITVDNLRAALDEHRAENEGTGKKFQSWKQKQQKEYWELREELNESVRERQHNDAAEINSLQTALNKVTLRHNVVVRNALLESSQCTTLKQSLIDAHAAHATTLREREALWAKDHEVLQRDVTELNARTNKQRCQLRDIDASWTTKLELVEHINAKLVEDHSVDMQAIEEVKELREAVVPELKKENMALSRRCELLGRELVVSRGYIDSAEECGGERVKGRRQRFEVVDKQIPIFRAPLCAHRLPFDKLLREYERTLSRLREFESEYRRLRETVHDVKNDNEVLELRLHGWSPRLSEF